MGTILDTCVRLCSGGNEATGTFRTTIGTRNTSCFLSPVIVTTRNCANVIREPARGFFEVTNSSVHALLQCFSAK